MKLYRMPGPKPPLFAAKIPKLVAATVAAVVLLVAELKVTWIATRPRGALDGMIAFTWFAVTTMGNAFIVVCPWMTWTETPAKVVRRGKPLTWAKVAGPMPCPKIENIDP